MDGMIPLQTRAEAGAVTGEKEGCKMGAFHLEAAGKRRKFPTLAGVEVVKK